MQVFSQKECFFRRFISVVVAFSVLACVFAVPVNASEYPDYLENLDGAFVIAPSFYEFLWNATLGIVADWAWGGDDNYYFNSVMDSSLWYCPIAAEQSDEVIDGVKIGWHRFSEGSSYYRDRNCIYCGVNYGFLIDELEASSVDYVSDLAPGLEAGSDGVTAYGSGVEIVPSSNSSAAYSWAKSIDFVNLARSADVGSFFLISSVFASGTTFCGYSIGRNSSLGVGYIYGSRMVRYHLLELLIFCLGYAHCNDLGGVVFSVHYFPLPFPDST